MSKSLVIVESPNKVKTISKFLGKNYTVKSSVGHIRDLSKLSTAKKSAKKKSTKKVENSHKEKYEKIVEKMGINPYRGWKASYDIIEGKEKVLQNLKDSAGQSATVFLATDLDREGEAIAWHLKEAIGGDENRYKRITFTEITKKAILEAFERPTTIDMNKVHAQQTRRFLDRVVGYMLSPLLWAKISRGLSAGRVQSVALKMICEREKEIQAFKTDEYWEIDADLKSKDKTKELSPKVTKYKGKAFRPQNKEQTDKAVAELKSKPYKVSSVEKKPTGAKPSPPFITSTLQQAASLKLNFGVKKTMLIAQKLYESGLITYMRTDSTSISKDALDHCRQYISSNFGSNYLPKDANIYQSKKNAQEAHEAIRPTDIENSKNNVISALDEDCGKLYDLIWRQFVACQMMPAKYNLTVVSIGCGDYTLKVKGRILIFDGFLKVQNLAKKQKDDELILPPLSEGEQLELEAIHPSQHFTKPPPRFTEASLVRELEKKSIGRPSTYASIISTIQERGYVQNIKRRFFCLKMGEIVTTRLSENFKELMDYGFTASMEEKLDKIANGEASWGETLDEFYESFVETLVSAENNMRTNSPTKIEIKCKLCNKEMMVRNGKTGVFLSCSGYALPPKERCKNTVNLTPGEEVQINSEDDDIGNVEEIQAKRRCKICDFTMDSYLVDEGTKLHVCGNNPDCPGYEIEKGKFTIKGYDGPIIKCDKCSADMQLRTGRFGKYFACTKAPECKNTRKLLKNGEAAPPRVDPIPMPELKCEKSDGHFILRDGAAGIFLASSLFPKSRETKKPNVSDLKRHKDKIDPKYIHLTKAPEKDPDGNPAIVKFSKKTKTHFIGSNINNKPTKWILIWQNNSWKEQK